MNILQIQVYVFRIISSRLWLWFFFSRRLPSAACTFSFYLLPFLLLYFFMVIVFTALIFFCIIVTFSHFQIGNFLLEPSLGIDWYIHKYWLNLVLSFCIFNLFDKLFIGLFWCIFIKKFQNNSKLFELLVINFALCSWTFNLDLKVEFYIDFSKFKVKAYLYLLLN